MMKYFSKFRQIAPWCIATGIFVWLFHVYPPAGVWEAITLVNVAAFVSFAIVYFTWLLICDSWSMTKVIGEFLHPVKFSDVLAARGATYLVMVINYPASQAAFAYYLKRRYGIPIFQALGIFFFILVIDLLWIVSLALAGSVFQDYSIAGISLDRTVQTVAIAAYSSLVLWIAFWRRWPEKLLGRPLRHRFIERLRERSVFHIFDRARAVDYLRVALMRTPIHIMIVFSMYVVLHTFNTDIPFSKILGNIPIVFFVGTLPITPGGLGTTNAMMVEMLSPYLTGPIIESGRISAKELVFAATLLWMFANYALKVAVGTVFLKRVSSELFRPTPEVPEEVAEQDAAHVGGNL